MKLLTSMSGVSLMAACLFGCAGADTADEGGTQSQPLTAASAYTTGAEESRCSSYSTCNDLIATCVSFKCTEENSWGGCIQGTCSDATASEPCQSAASALKLRKRVDAGTTPQAPGGYGTRCPAGTFLSPFEMPIYDGLFVIGYETIWYCLPNDLEPAG